MKLITKLECLLVGWKPEILQNCGEVSYATLKKYVAAITILTIIWGTIGWCFADNYLAIQSWYGKVITSLFFILVVICIERYIILSHGNLTTLRIFRTFLAFLMATLGSTIFDQIVFKNDINVQMTEVRTEQINAEIPKRTIQADAEIKEERHLIDSIKVVNEELQKAIDKQPMITIYETTTIRRQVGTSAEGKPIFGTEVIVGKHSVPNPKIEQKNNNETYQKQHEDRVKELQDYKLNIAKEVREEYEKKPSGFLEELSTLYSLLSKNLIVMLFYVFLFLFLMSLELLVITGKVKDNCEYDMLLDFQLEQRHRELKALGNK